MKRFIYFLGYHLVYGSLFILSILPLNLLYLFSDIAFFLVYYVFRYRRDIVIQNLSRAFPEKKYPEIHCISKKFYHLFTDYFAEMGKMLTASVPLMQKRVRFRGTHIIEDYIREGKSVIVSLGHCGNWEMLNMLPMLLNSGVYAVYKPLRNKISDRLMLRLRSRFGIKPIPSGAVVRHLLNKENPPAVYLFLADQCPEKINEHNKYTFLNQETGVYMGVEKLAKATASAVVFFRITLETRGCYQIDCIPVCRNAQTDTIHITSVYLRLLEENIKKEPHSWLWTHKRWKR
ncbi:MAG: lysophospholipid acyltransferase family protein [Tannerellaceae bacterium]|jgi:KDO2-lipid IV(A) lauroyltransferase|nr:lysophospholipid acyltransferase family protein [Tannerellaceae bacterium]